MFLVGTAMKRTYNQSSVVRDVTTRWWCTSADQNMWRVHVSGFWMHRLLAEAEPFSYWLGRQWKKPLEKRRDHLVTETTLLAGDCGPRLILNRKNNEDTHWSFNHILVAAAGLWVEGLREIECISRYSLDAKTGFIQVSSSYCRKGKVNSRAK